MATTASTKPQGATFGPDQDDIADRVERAEAVLYQWACGNQTARDVRRILATHRIHLLDRLNPHGLPSVAAEVEGYGVLTLNF